ncbi:hypothetical protein NPIL_457791, partial [Nephila pilipes]
YESYKNYHEKAAAAKKDPYFELLNYRNTPLDSIGKSQAQLVLEKRLRRIVPTMCKLFEPGLNNYQEVKELKGEKRHKISQRYPGSVLLMLKLGDNVFVGVHHKGLPRSQGIASKVITSRTIEVTTDEGRKNMRNKVR